MADPHDEFKLYMDYNDDWINWATEGESINDNLSSVSLAAGSQGSGGARPARASAFQKQATELSPTSPKPNESTSKLKFVCDSATFHLNYLNRRVSSLEYQFTEKFVSSNEPALYPVSDTPEQVTRTDLDRVCMPTFRECVEPIGSQLHVITSELETSFPNISRKCLLSLVRKWFRKRREELTFRLLQYFRSKHDIDLVNGESRAALFRSISEGRYDFRPIIRASHVSLQENEHILQFHKEKVVAFLEKMD